MNDLLDSTIEAHGGLAAWRKVSQVSADFSANGAGLRARGPVGDDIAKCRMRVTVNTRKQDVRFDGYLGDGNRGLYEPNRTVILGRDGAVLEALDNPRESLTKKTPGTPWAGAQLLYFLGYSLWMYITSPYNLLEEGSVLEEVEPLTEDGETWRGLKATYGPAFPTHSTDEIHYFDPTGVMRRQDYTVDVRQNLSVAHYMFGQRKFDGFLFPTERRIYRRAEDGTPLEDQLLIAADLGDYVVTRDAG